MTEEVKQMIQQILDSSDEDKVALGQQSLSRFLNGLKENGFNDDDLPKIIVAITRLFVSADKHCSEKEYRFFKNVTEIDISYQEFYEMTTGGADIEYVKSVLGFIVGLNKEERVAVVLFGVALLSSDNVVEYKELRLIDTIINAEYVHTEAN